jgi:hypothetical protein
VAICGFAGFQCSIFITALFLSISRLFLYENRISPFDINMLRNHVFAGARHPVPLPGNLRICEFYEHEASLCEH